MHLAQSLQGLPKTKQKDCRNREVSELCHPLGKVPQDSPGVWGKSNNPAQIQSKTVPSPRQTCQGPHALLDHLFPPWRYFYL